MGNYLSNIAARNAPNNSPSLLPSPSLSSELDNGIIQDLSEETVMEENNQQITSAPKSIIPVQPVDWKPTDQEIDNKKSETLISENSTASNYISRHIERISYNEKSDLLKDDSQKNEYVELSENTTANIILKDNEKDSPAEKKIIPKILQEKKSGKDQAEHNDDPIFVRRKSIKPTFKKEDQKKGNLLSNRLNITPNQVIPENKTSVTGKNNKVAPKLAIGKIIVEVLPQEKQTPPRVVTRVVQPSTDNNNSKMNKLSFGLGQL